MVDGANRHRRHVEFEVGEVVWLKLQPYRQHSVAKPLSAKLAPRYYGPFEILERVGPVAYKLRLPEGSRIHNVFHVNLLREFVAGDGDVDGVKLPPEFVGDRPVAILEERVNWHYGKPEKQVLVQWEDDDATLTWEPLEEMRRRFPDVRLEGKSIFNGGGVDTSPPITSTVQEENTLEEPETEHETEPEVAREAPPARSDQGKGKAAPTRTLRPREKLKPPSKFQS